MEPTYPTAQPPSPPPRQQNHHPERRWSTTRYHPTQGFTDRVLRALEHRLLLLNRSDPNFYVLGATGNVYVVNVSTTLACTCPDRATPCKHILFVLIKVLGVSLDDPFLRRRTLRPSHVTRLLANPTSTDSPLAGYTLRERFHRAFFLQSQRDVIGGTTTTNAPSVVVEEGATCPICLEEMGSESVSGERLVGCGTCRNFIHEDCFKTWKRTQRRRSVSCVICRSRWKDIISRADHDQKYLNLAAYVQENDQHVAPQSEGSSTCRDL
ncbi:hypothetical protein SOVF_185870 [Spinacia oleracea]|uniref:Mitogen-activated protein kinase kinase kinase 1 n=1 Tax=Spinacia oleracea TaxID=3562 RepID=A0A9R0JV70_SPIOL|nr:uncharacterized protein LOC110787454 [Spinacia oleracea]KNA05921.1 hypothetical protein SOVF_185870 [Spinacia oleracea]